MAVAGRNSDASTISSPFTRKLIAGEQRSCSSLGRHNRICISPCRFGEECRWVGEIAQVPMRDWAWRRPSELTHGATRGHTILRRFFCGGRYVTSSCSVHLLRRDRFENASPGPLRGGLRRYCCHLHLGSACAENAA